MGGAAWVGGWVEQPGWGGVACVDGAAMAWWMGALGGSAWVGGATWVGGAAGYMLVHGELETNRTLFEGTVSDDVIYNVPRRDC